MGRPTVFLVKNLSLRLAKKIGKEACVARASLIQEIEELGVKENDVEKILEDLARVSQVVVFGEYYLKVPKKTLKDIDRAELVAKATISQRDLTAEELEAHLLKTISTWDIIDQKQVALLTQAQAFAVVMKLTTGEDPFAQVGVNRKLTQRQQAVYRTLPPATKALARRTAVTVW